MPRSTQDPKDRKRDAIDPAGFDALASASVALLEPLQASQWDTAQSTVPIGLTAALRQFSGVAASGGFQALAQLADLIAARLVALVEDECADSPGGSLETLIGCLVEFCAGDPGRAPASRLLEEFQRWAGPSSQPGPRVRKQLAAEAQRLLAFTSWRDGEPMQAPSASSGGNALPLLAQASIELSEEIQTLRRRSGVTDGSLITTVLKRLQAIDQACAAIGATAACEVLAKLQAAVQSCLTDPAPRDERLRMLLAEVSRRLSNYFSAMGPESAQELVALLSEPGWPSRVPARVARRLAADLSELQGLEAGSDERDPSAVTSENLSLEVADDAQPEVVAELLEELSSLAQPLTWHLQAALAGSRQDLAAALRIAHTLKGAAQTATIRGVATLTHRIEDVLEPLAARPSALEPGLRAELLAAVDCLTAMTDALTGRGPEPANASQICDSLGIWAALILSRPREHPGAWEELGQSLAAADPVGDSAHQASDREPPPRAARLRKTLAISGVAARLERVVEQAGRLAGRQVDLVIKGRSLRL
ncbi:MAG: Hpt domain-containing protein, partial [Quisquiliibacterium sp.]